MSKRGSLVEALKSEDLANNKQDGNNHRNTEPVRYTSPCRVGKKSMTIWFDPDVIMQLKLIGLREGLSLQAMMSEAVNDFFSKHHQSRIA